MTLHLPTLALIAVFLVGYLAAISIGTWAYFANERD